jgi:hypothetical membrane protein
MVERRVALTKLGYVGPVVSVGLTVLASLLDPKFDWRSRSLSSMGEATGQSLTALGSLDQLAFSAFNLGLFAAGVFGLPFLVVLWADSGNRIERIGIGLAAVTLLGSIGVAVAFVDGPFDPYHFLAAMTFFFGLTFTLWVYGTGLAKRTGGDHGLGAVWFANVHAVGWIIWIMLEAFLFTGDGDTWTYFAIPEFVGAVCFAAFVFLQARRLDV